MANKFRGEAVLKFTRIIEEGDKEVEKPAEFKLVFDANALCEIEDATGLGMGGILGSLSDPKQMKVSTVRAFIWGGLTRHHPGITLTEAGDIIADAGLDVVVAAMQEAIGDAMPKSKGGAPGEAKAKSIRGTGTRR